MSFDAKGQDVAAGSLHDNLNRVGLHGKEGGEVGSPVEKGRDGADKSRVWRELVLDGS